MAITRGQMTKQVDGQLSGARINKKSRKKVKKVMKGLQKASKTHAAQAKTLKGVLSGRVKKTKKMR
tara:strand:- start:139 stop:336 length:198 start_codon:yes stop_codon:yes gene_type:complete